MMRDWDLLILPAGLLAFILAILLWSSGRFDSYDQHCAEAGGHIYKPGSAHYCLSDDGRMIEVYP